MSREAEGEGVSEATHRIIVGDCIEGMASLPDGSVHCCITSPPYWGLRDYGTATWDGGDAGCDHQHETKHQSQGSSSQRAGRANIEAQRNENFRDTCGKCGARRIDRQIGLEATPDAYVATMVAVFREVRRVLRDDGTLWLNLGDSYAHNGACGGGSPDGPRKARETDAAKQRDMNYRVPPGLKPKDLCGIPWRVALALQADGWWLRQDIIWHKPNPMPESVTDRCTKAHEYVFLLSKSATYYYDAEAVKEAADPSTQRSEPVNATMAAGNMTPGNDRRINYEKGRHVVYTRNRRSVWTIPTAPYSGSHFATFPPKLVEPMILAGTSAKGCCATCGKPWERVVERTKYEPPTALVGERFVDESRGDKTRKLSGKDYNEQVRSTTLGWQPTCTCGGEPVPCTVLDPFGGSGTTAAVALQHGRNAIICELNPEYAKLAERRIGEATRPDTYRDETKADDAPLFNYQEAP